MSRIIVRSETFQTTLVYKIYNKVIKRLSKTTTMFIETCNSLIKKI